MASAAFDALRAVDNQARQNNGASSTFLGRIAAAPRSPVQAEALTQAQLINDDCARSESQVSRIAAARRQQISAYFSGARQGLSNFFTRSVATVQAVITSQQAELMAAVTRAFAWIRAAVIGTLQAAQALAGQIRTRINQALENISTSVQGRVEGIAGQITGLIDSIPLPDIPGIGRIRAAAVSLLNRAAGVVNGAFDRLVDFVGWAFNAGMDLLDSILSTITSLVDTALSLASSAILSVLQMIGQALNQAVALIGATLRGALLAVIIPILNNVESLIARLIGSAEQSALGLLRRNRNEYLSSLVEAVTPGATPQGSQATSTESQIAILRRLGRDATQNNRMIVQVFDALTSGNLASMIRLLASAAARTVAGIAAFLAQVIRAIVTAVTRALQILTQIAQSMGSFLRELLQSFIAWVGNLVEYMRSLVQRGADQLIRFAQNGLSRIGNFIRRFVQNLILGRSLSESLTDALGEFNLTRSFSPTPASFLGPAPAFAGGPIEIIAGFVIIIIGGLTIVLPLWLAIVIVVVIILVLLLIIYLIWRWLTKPKPPPPPCTIVTRTLVSAPDGTADTRRVVGINERIQMTVSGSATWSATRGTVSPVIGPTTIWTAPDPGGSCTITARTTAGATCSVAMQVIPPGPRRQTKLSDRGPYTPGLAGSGFVGKVTFTPTSVSFSRLESREDTARGIAVGYYDTVLHWNGIIHPAGRWLPIDSANSGRTDTVGTNPPGTPPPFSKGKFTWPIPQLYRLVGGSGATPYTTAMHVQEMTGPTGEETTSKDGEARTRTP